MTVRARTRQDCEDLDAADPLRARRERFALPNGVIYLDGNSLGPAPRAALARAEHVAKEQWARGLIRSWNDAGWFQLPAKTGDKIGRLIGAPTGSVIVADTISVNLFKLLSAALDLAPGRKVILADNGNFPSDLYVAQGLIRRLDRDLTLRVVEPEEVEAAINETVAALMLTEVDYRSARVHDMKALTAKAHAKGAVTVWDLAHSAGAIEVDLTAANADFAHGCTYKYLNGGPGAPAFLYVRPDLQAKVQSPIAGWWGHEAPFAFDLDYRPAPGVTRFQCGTQPMLSLATLDAAMDEWDGLSMADIRAKSLAMTGLFADLAMERCGAQGLSVVGPADPNRRGSHVSLRHAEGYALMRALTASGVIGDFRAPDMIRFGFAPLYNRFVEIWDAVDTLSKILGEGRWKNPDYQRRRAVT